MISIIITLAGAIGGGVAWIQHLADQVSQQHLDQLDYRGQTNEWEAESKTKNDAWNTAQDSRMGSDESDERKAYQALSDKIDALRDETRTDAAHMENKTDLMQQRIGILLDKYSLSTPIQGARP